jgi:putative endonuclease
MALAHERGRLGEAHAARYLVQEGWTILDRNWRAGHGEIDLVARRGNVVAFVEVKTRSGGDGSDPLEGITWGKRREVERTARRWVLGQGDRGGKVDYRFDAIAVTLSFGGGTELRHLPDAWWIGDP